MPDIAASVLAKLQNKAKKTDHKYLTNHYKVWYNKIGGDNIGQNICVSEKI